MGKFNVGVKCVFPAIGKNFTQNRVFQGFFIDRLSKRVYYDAQFADATFVKFCNFFGI
jgi:hypothetical protein